MTPPRPRYNINMNIKRHYSLADLLDAALTSFAQVSGPVVDVESRCVPAKRSVPMPVKAIFNLKTEDMVPVLDENGSPVYEQGAGENSPKKVVKQAKTLEKPILASKVFFDDGSWTVVKNSGEDTVDVVEKTLSNGNTVKAATDASKERAIAYAVVKRVFGRVDPATGEVKGANLGRRFEKVIAASIDQNVGTAEDKIKKAEAKPVRKAKPKKQCRYGGRENGEKLENLLKSAEGVMAELVKKLNLGELSEKGQEGA